MEKRKLISIICPVFNEEKAIGLFYSRLQQVLLSLRRQYDFELIFTNNRSTDNSLKIIGELRKSDPSVQVLTMSRNFGYQASIQAGLTFASGDGLIIIDVDCEDPPELIPKFLQKWEEGYDVVYGIRNYKNLEWKILKKGRKLFYHILKKSADMDIVLYMAEFSLMSSAVRDAIINNKNTFPFLRSEVGYVGFSRYGIPYDRQPRIAGKTHYNLIKIFSFAIAGFLTSSTFLFRLAGYLFPVVFLANLALLIPGIYHPTIYKILAIFDFTYIIYLLTIHGMYLARVYKNAIGRPIFIIDKKHTYVNGNVNQIKNLLSKVETVTTV